MGWRRLGVEELLSGPVAWWWWNDHHRLGVRTAARKQFSLAQSIAELTLPDLSTRFLERLTVHGYTGDGWPVTTSLSLCTALADATLPWLADAADRLPAEPGLREWWLGNEGGINDLTMWFAVVGFLTEYLAEAPVCQVADFSQEKLTVYNHPRDAAMAHANYVVGIHQRSVALIITDHLQFSLLYTRVREMDWGALMAQAGLPLRF